MEIKPFLPDKVYEILRWVVCTVIPALITLCGTIGLACHISYTDIVLIIIGAVGTFLGVIFGFNKIAYDKQQEVKVNE